VSKNDTQTVAGRFEGNVLVATVQVSEICDDRAAFLVRDEILAMLQSAEVEHVVIDLAATESMGSVGFLAFLGVRRELLDTKGRMVLCNLSPSICKMYLASRLISDDPKVASAFETANSVNSALDSIANS